MVEPDSPLTDAELEAAGIEPESKRKFRKGLFAGFGLGLGTGVLVFVIVALVAVTLVGELVWGLFSAFIDAAWGH